MWVFGWFSSLIVESRARRDAAVGVHNGEELFRAKHGARPTFDPQANLVHARWASESNDSARLEEYLEDRRRVQEELAKQPAAWKLLLKLAACYFVELLGCVLILRAMSVANPELTVLAGALAAFCLAVVYAIEQNVRTEATNQLAARRKTRVLRLLVLGYVAFVASGAILRMYEVSNTEDAPFVVAVAGGVVTICLTLGPAFLARTYFAALKASEPARQEAARLSKLIRQEEARHDKAWRMITRRIQAGERYDQAQARLSAKYNAAHSLERAYYAPNDGHSTTAPQRERNDSSGAVSGHGHGGVARRQPAALPSP